MRQLLLLFSLMFVFSHAQGAFFVGKGGTGFSSLNIPLSARAVGLAEAFTAIHGNTAALDYNPAGLSGLNERDIRASYINHLDDSSLQSLGFAFPYEKVSGKPSSFRFGFQYRLFRVEDEARSNLGVSEGDFDNRDQFFQAATSFDFKEKWAFGTSLKMINNKLQDESVTLFAGDVGALYKSESKWVLGASVLNLGPGKAFLNEEEALPLLFRVGAQRPFKKLRLSFDGSTGRGQSFRPAFGAEWKPSIFVSLRAGTFHEDSLHFSGGLGVQFFPDPSGSKPFELGLDYGLQTQNELSVTHTVTLKCLY